MPSKTKPIVSPSSDVWGNKLNQHLEQLMPDDGGGINKFEQFSQRPTNLTTDDKGKTYLYTQTGNFHQWSGTEWKVLNESVINVKDYGAVGDGFTDDTAAIQKCLNEFNNIYFPKGIYCTGTMNIPSKKSLLGDGDSLSELKNMNNFENHYLYSFDETDITIDSMFLNGNKDGRMPNGAKAWSGSTYQFGITDPGTARKENNIVIKNCKIGGNGFNNIGAVSAKNVTIDNCKFINGRDSGISSNAALQWKVTNCTFDDTMMFPVSFSSNGLRLNWAAYPNPYAGLGLCSDIIISNNIINVGKNSHVDGSIVNAYGIQIDGTKNLLITNNIIRITEGGMYGIRIIPSRETALFDCYNIDIISNRVINESTKATIGIEIWNDENDTEQKNMKVESNTIINNVGSGFIGINILNINRITIANNIINSYLNNKYSIGIRLEEGNANNIDVIQNDISGATIGIQCGDVSNTQTVIQKVRLNSNKVYNNTTNLGLGKGWEFFTQNNYTPNPNYLTPYAIHGDFRLYNSAPTAGMWDIGEIVYASNPVPGSYIGWICTTAGTPGTWKGFGLIEL
jgi:hypothetical protein